MQPVLVEKRGDETIEIFIDHEPPNPRTEWDNLGTMLCRHPNYTLGDEQLSQYHSVGVWLHELLCESNMEREDINGYYTQHWEDFVDDLEADDEEAIGKAYRLLHSKLIMLPLFLLDHGGLTMNTTGFYCPWDSGQVGHIYVNIEAVKKEWGWKYLTKVRREKIEALLRGEVDTYNQYLQGNVYSFVHIVDGEEIDASTGCYTDDLEQLADDVFARKY